MGWPALFLAAVQTASPMPGEAVPDPALVAELRGALAAADGHLRHFEDCAQRTGRGFREEERVSNRYFSVLADAIGLFGPEIDPPPPQGQLIEPRICLGDFAAGLSRRTDQALERAERTLRRQTGRMPGLWLGLMRVCAENVEAVTFDYSEIGNPMAVIRLKPHMAEPLRAATATRVGQVWPVRVDGEVVMSPNVLEPIEGGALSVEMATQDQARRLRRAVRRSCR